MEIPPSSIGIDFRNQRLVDLYRSRLQQRVDARAAMALPLLGYMSWPNDSGARIEGMMMLRQLMAGANEPLNFRLIATEWARVADIVNIHYGLSQGGHQEIRGGTSVGKAISLVSTRTKRRGAKQATLWRNWKRHKDVAHLIAATIAICFEVQTSHRKNPFGIGLQELHPIWVACLMPDLILGLALTYQEYGLNSMQSGSGEPMLDPESVWRIPSDINIGPVSPPVRTILTPEIVILNARRAGNRGRANRRGSAIVA
jgi:hypothetical protein